MRDAVIHTWGQPKWNYMPLSSGHVFFSMKQLFLLISPQNMEISGFVENWCRVSHSVSTIHVCDKYEVWPLRFVKKKTNRKHKSHD